MRVQRPLMKKLLACHPKPLQIQSAKNLSHKVPDILQGGSNDVKKDKLGELLKRELKIVPIKPVA